VNQTAAGRKVRRLPLQSMERTVFGDISRRIHEEINFRNEPMLRLLRACIEELEARECEPRISLILREARLAVQGEDAFHCPKYLDSLPERN
jgi:hypothetical protein